MEKLERSRVRLEVDVGTDDIRQAWEKAARRVVGRATIPGFRRGRAPRGLVERHLGKELFRKETLDLLLPEAYARAVRQVQLEPVDLPDLEVLEFDEDRVLRFKATVDVRPEVELGTYRGMGLELAPPEVTSEQVEAEIGRLREAHAQLEDRGEEPLRPGWLAVVNYRMVIGEGSLEEAPDQDALLELGSAGLLPGVSEALDGACAGEVREFDVNVPEDPAWGAASGQEVRFRVAVRAVKEKVVPALDEDFARTVAGLASLEELPERVKNRLTEVARLEALAKVQQAVLARVVEEARVDLPEALIIRRQLEIREELHRDLARRGFTMEQYLSSRGLDAAALEAGIRSQAEQEVKLNLVLDAIAAAEGIRATAEDIEVETQSLALRHGLPVEAVRKWLAKADALDKLQKSLVRQKTLDFLVQVNTSGRNGPPEREEGV